MKNGPRGVPDRAIGVMMDDTEAYEAARTLSDVNAQLKLAVDLGKIAIWRRDLRTGRMHLSDVGFELLGMAPRPEGLSLDEVRSLIHPDDFRSSPRRSSRRWRRTSRSTWRRATAAPTAAGATCCRAASSSATQAGEAIAFVGVSLDTTERVEHLRHAEELARRLDAASRAAGVGIWTTTADLGSTDWNAQMFELFDRCTPPTAPSFGQWLAESVHADDRERVRRESQAYFASGDGPYEIEFRSLRKDGSERWIVLRADVDRDTAGPRRVVGVAMDVTAHHRALDALREASERAAFVTSHAGIGTWEADAAGCGRWNEQMFHLRGLAPRETAPSREEWMALVHPDDVSVVLEGSPDAAAALLPMAYEFRVRLPDGSYRWLASRSAAVLDEPAGRCAASASTGTSPRARTPSSRASRRRSPSARSRPSRSSSRA